jgi:predicted amidohydrolase
MKALLAQLESVVRDPRANAARAVAALETHPDVEIAVFPELYLSAYDLSSVSATALALDAPELVEIADAAARMRTAVVVGFVERLTDGLANSAACIDSDGTLAAVYRKTQLFAGERNVFRAGEELSVVRLAGIAAAPLVCFDIEFPEPARAVAGAGAELLVTISANMEPYGPEHELAGRARALDNRLPHLDVNAVGAIGMNRFVGGSRSVGAGGEVLAQAGAAEELLVAPIGRPGRGDPDVDYLHRVPAALRVVVHAPVGG